MDEGGVPPPHPSAGRLVHAPRLRPDVVHRERLLGRLREQPGRLVLVVAPAGFGKTTFVLDWLRDGAHVHAWLALEASDNDARSFFARVARALRDLGAGQDAGPAGATLEDALQAQAPVALLVARLLEELAAIDREVVLVFDDYHRIDRPELHEAMADVLERLPPRVRLVLVSRVDPPFPLGRLRLGGDVVELRQRDLRFTSDEALAFLERSLGRPLDPADARALEARTEGWIAGLQMAAISLRHEPDLPAFVRTFTGSHAYVVDYLLEEVVGRQAPDMQQFLLRTSILPRLDARLCRAVTERDDAPRLLADAERAGLFVVSLDDRRAWFRYHHLFAELLSERLRHLHPEEWDRLHARASRWFEAEGDLSAALHHAGEMTSPERLLHLLERHSEELLNRSELATFAAWAARIPSASTRGHPSFLVSRAWLHLLTERFADLEPLLEAAEAAVAETAFPYTDEEKAAFLGVVATQRAYLLRLQDRFEAAAAATEQALEGPAARSVRNRGLLLYNLGRTQLHLGALHPARQAFEQAYACTWQARTWYLALASSGYLGAIAAQEEGLHAGRERLEAALAYAADARLDGLPACGVLHYQLGLVLYLQDELDAAEAAFRRAQALGEAGRVHEVISNALVGQARVCGARGDGAGAHERLRQVAVLRQSAHVRLFEADYDGERARLAMLEGDRVHLAAWTAAQAARARAPYTTVREQATLLQMQACLLDGRAADAAPFVDALCRTAERLGRRLTHRIARLGRCLVLDAAGDEAAAVALLEAVLVEAAAERLVRPFAELGAAMRALLERALRTPLAPAADAFARRLLGGPPAAPASPHAHPAFRQPLREPLTDREQEVLFHLSRRLSYQAVADALFVSHDTVKSHVRHLYAKLGASSRGEALERARQAGFVLYDAGPAAPPRPGTG